MSSWVELTRSYVKAAGPSTAPEIAEGTGLPLAFVRNALRALEPPLEKEKEPHPLSGWLVLVEGDRFAFADPPPAPPLPDPRPCTMTSTGEHVFSPNPMNVGVCAACGHPIGLTDPVRAGPVPAR